MRRDAWGISWCKNAAARRHPLAAAVHNASGIAEAVFVVYAAPHEVGKGFNAPVRMGGKPLV